MRIKRLCLANGDEYENISTEANSADEIFSEGSIKITCDKRQIYLSTEFIISVELEKEPLKIIPSDKDSVTVDYGAVNLKSLIITNDREQYEKKKSQGYIGTLFEPGLLDVENQKNGIYVIGILADTVAPLQELKISSDLSSIDAQSVINDLCRGVDKSLKDAISTIHL